MIIETKYSIGDKVYFKHPIYYGELESSIITGIEFQTYKNDKGVIEIRLGYQLKGDEKWFEFTHKEVEFTMPKKGINEAIEYHKELIEKIKKLEA